MINIIGYAGPVSPGAGGWKSMRVLWAVVPSGAQSIPFDFLSSGTACESLLFGNSAESLSVERDRYVFVSVAETVI